MRKLTILFFVFLFVSLTTATTFTDKNPFSGTFTDTFYNSSLGAIQLNISGGFSEGTYSNEKTIAGLTSWNNLTFTKGWGWEFNNDETPYAKPLDTTNMISHWTWQDGTDGLLDTFGVHNLTDTGGAGVYKNGKINNAVDVTNPTDYQFTMNPNGKELALVFWMNKSAITGTDVVFESGASYGTIDGGIAIIERDTCANDELELAIQDSAGTSKFRIECFKMPVGKGWVNWIAYFNNTNTTGDIRVFENNVELTSSISVNSKDQSSNLYSGIYNLFSRNSASLWAQNYQFDEWFIYTQLPNEEQRQLLVDRGMTRLNLTASNGTTTLSTGFGETYLNISSLIGTTVNYTAYFETDNLSYTPLLYNVTINYESATPPPVVNKTYTTINHLDFEVEDQAGSSYDTATYALISNFTFNLTSNQNYIIKTSGQAQKINLPQATTISLMYKNGGTLFDQEIVTLPGGTEERRVFTTPIVESMGALGQNNVEVWLKEDGLGAVNISNMELHIDFNTSSAGESINQQVVNVSGSVTSTDFVHIANWTFTRLNNATGVLGDIHITMTNSAGGDSVGKCQIRSGANNVSEVVERYVSAGNTGSTGLNQILNTTLMPATLNPELWCTSGNIGTTMDILATAHNLELRDSAGNYIEHATNSSKDLTLNAGWTKINSITGGSRESGEATFLAYINAQAITGGSTDTDSPLFKINSTLPEENCSLTYARSLEDSNSPGTIKMNAHCSGFTIGVQENVSLWVWVAPGEQIEIISSNLAGYEATEVSTNPINTPPVVSIQNPINNSVVQGWDFINFTVSDPEGQATTCSITLNGTTNYVLSSDATSPFELNWGIYVPNNYSLQVYCSDTFGDVGFSIYNIEVLATSTGLTADQESCIFTGYYVNGTICAIGNAGGEKQMAGLSLVIFMLVIVGALFALPYKIGSFTKNNVTDFILKRSCLAIGIYLLMLTATMIATIIDSAGIALTREVFTMVWIIGIAGYLSLVWLVFGTILEVTKLWKKQNSNSRMEDDEEDYYE